MTDRLTDREWPPYDPNGSPFDSPDVEGIPFGKDSEEARAIERILRRAARDARTRGGGDPGERRETGD